MIGLVLSVALVLVAHEAAHWVLLRWAGASPRLAARAWGLKGAGWAFDPRGVPMWQLRVQGVAGPLVGCLGWGLLMRLEPGAFGLWVVLLAVEVVGNGLLPGSDGWKAVHRRATSYGSVTSAPGGSAEGVAEV